MTLKIANFEAGPQDGSVTTANEPNINTVSAGAGGSITFDAAMAAAGSYGAKFTCGTSAGCLLRSNPATASDQVSTTLIITGPSATPTQNLSVVQLRSASATPLTIRWSTLNNLQLLDAANTVLATLVTGVTFGAKYRISLVVNRATGAATVKVYAGTSTTVLGSYTAASGTNLGADPVNSVGVGFNQTMTTSLTMGVDYLATNDGSSAEIGPPAANNAPTADAGASQYVAAGQTVTLTGTGTDSDGTIASRAWTCTAYPGASAPTITNGTQATATAVLADAGRYTFHHTVTDNQGLTGSSDVVEYAYAGSNTPVKVYSVTPGVWANGGGAASVTAALNDADVNTYAQSPDNPAGEQLRAVLNPLGLGAINLLVSGYAATGTVTRTVTLYKEDGTSVIYTESWTLPATDATRTVSVDPVGLALIPNLADRRALVVTVADKAA